MSTLKGVFTHSLEIDSPGQGVEITVIGGFGD